MRRDAQRGSGGSRANALFLFVLGVISLAACANVLGIDEGARRGGKAGGGGGAGSGGSAGRHGGAGGNAATSDGAPMRVGGSTDGGASGGPAGEGGDSAAPQGGSSPARGGSGGAGSGAAEAGSSGEAPRVPGIEQLGAPCQEEWACSDANPFLVLWCVDGVWQAQMTCDLGLRCDPREPACVPVDSICAEFGPIGPLCDGSSVVDCSPDLYAAEYHECPFGCHDGACDPGSATELTLHTRVVAPTGNAWTDTVPVCIATEDAGVEADWVRDEIERVFNRFISVEFVGWDACDEDPTGVVLTFADDCRGSLVNDIAPGKPNGDESLPLTICRSFYDNVDEHHPVGDNESLVRLLARHQFAHVLAFVDGTDARQTVMVRGVELGHENELTLTSADYLYLYSVLGKGPDRISTPTGDCLGATSTAAGASVVARTCTSATTRQDWSPVNDRIQIGTSNKCWYPPAVSGGSVTLANCELSGDEQLIRLAHAQWRTPTLCVAPEHLPPKDGTRLVTEPCQVGAASQAWFFDVRGSGDTGYYRIQIHFGGPFDASDLCVSSPLDAAQFDPVELAPCATSLSPGDPQLVLMGPNGILGNGQSGNSYCLNWQMAGGLLQHDTCGLYSAYFASGALEAANQTALTLSATGTLVIDSLGATPQPNQIFDVSF